MPDEYGKRKSKGDKKAKSRYNSKYKKGGKRRAGKIKEDKFKSS